MLVVPATLNVETPAERIALAREIARVMNQSEIQARLLSMSAGASPTTPQEFDQLISEQVALTMELAKQVVIKPE